MSTDRRDDERPVDRAIARAWRAESRDEPSAQLDAAILAAARAEANRVRPVQARHPSRHWWVHWQPLAAAAGVAGLAFIVVQMLPRDQAPATMPSFETEPPGRDVQSSQESAVPPAMDSAPETAPSAHEQDASAQLRAPAAAAPPAVAPTAPEPPPAMEPAAPAQRATPAAPAAPAASVAGEQAAGMAAETEVPAGKALRRPAQASSPLPPPADWVRRIEALLARGDEEAAADALRSFRESYPDADQYLPAGLRSWAAGRETPDGHEDRQE
jgi:hypothetical protein